MDLLTLSFDPAFVSTDTKSSSLSNFSVPNPFTSTLSLLTRSASNASLKSQASSHSSSVASSNSSLQRSASLAQKCSQLDISRISNRILVCSRCYSERQAQKQKQNDSLQLAAFLRGRFHESFLLWNFGTPESLSSACSTAFGSKLIPMTLPRSQHPTLKQLFHLCHGLLGWLQLNPQNVAVIQCTDGITRSGLIVACLLRFCGAFGSTFEALDYFCLRRELNSAADPRQNPSIRRLLRYFNDTCVLSGRVPQPNPLSLHQVIVNSVPNFDGEGGCRAGLEIFCQNGLVGSSECFLQDSNHMAFKFETCSALSGDLQFHLFHTDERTRQRSTIAYFSLNTAFTQAGIIRFCAGEMEIPYWDTLAPITKFADASRPGQRRFTDGFSVDLIMLSGTETSPLSFESTVQTNPAKNLIRLSQFHPFRPDRSLLQTLCSQGWSRVLAKVALQLSGNDIHAAHELLAGIEDRREIEAFLEEYSQARREKSQNPLAEPEAEMKEVEKADQNGINEHTKEEDECFTKEDLTNAALSECIQDDNEQQELVSENQSHATQESTLDNHSEEATVSTVDVQSSTNPLLEEMLKTKLTLKQPSPRLPSQAPSPQPINEQQKGHRSEINETLRPVLEIPTPPPLPNFAAQTSSIPPPPPPMPPLLSTGIPIAPPPPRPRIKNSLHWSELKNIPSIDQTVWSELSSPGRSCFSKAEFEELFCIQPGRETLSRKASVAKEDASIASDLPLIIDVRRANNVGIGLARFNKRFDSISCLLQTIYEQPEVFSYDDYCALSAILPNEEETAALKLIKPSDGLLERMGRAELFMYEVSTSHAQLPALLQVRCFQCSAPLDIFALKDKFSAITAALKQIKDSAELKLILKAALELGNLANYEYGRLKASFTPGVRAFTLDSLCHLHEVKSVDGSSNLLLFLVQSLLPEHPEICVIADGEAWKDLDGIKSWNGSFLLAELDTLKRECERLRELWDGSQESAALDGIRNLLSTLQPVADEFSSTWQATRAYFGEDPRDPPSIFEDVSVFIGTCAQFSKNLSAAIKQQTQLKRTLST